jgi:Fe-S cluster assembly protein SufD
MAARAGVGFERFQALAMPSPKDEDWRYVDLTLDLADFSLAGEPGRHLPWDPLVAALTKGDAGHAVLVDGFAVEAVAGEGVSVDTLAGAANGVLEAFEPRAPEDRFSALHDAFASSGVVIHARRGVTVERPVVVDVQAATSAAVTLPTLFVLAEEEASVSVLIHQRSADGLRSLVIPRVEVVAGAAARVHVTVVQAWGDETVSVAAHRMTGDRDSTVGLAEAGLGGSFSRLRLDVTLAGRGASAAVIGAYFGDRRQTLDYRYFMRHEAPNTTSDMFLKGAVGDTARSVFTGLIRIEPAGQKTNAHQTNRNLVLSQGAEAHSVPNLEILANDVRCGHGSAVGPLDEEQRYYLMSRGLSRGRADRLQVKGFFEEALGRFPIEEIVPALRDRALDKYAGVMS